MEITGKILRVTPLKEVGADKDKDRKKKVVDLIVADSSNYWRVSLRDDKTELAEELREGDVVRIENARMVAEKRVYAGKYSDIIRVPTCIDALSRMKAQNLTVLAVARPEKGRVCIAGINEHGEWIRPQGIYEADVFPPSGSGTGAERFRNLCISKIYVDAWRGRRPRIEDRFFIYGEGVKRELSEAEKREFLARNLDPSVDAVFKKGRSLGLIKPRILHVYEEFAPAADKDKEHESYIRFNFRDSNGRIYRRWSCRCSAFYKLWNDFKRQHRFTYSWRIHRYLKKNDTYLAIGLTYTDYGVERLEYGAYPMIVGVHVVKKG
ncbi:MAG: hypothetical protein ACXQTW_04225 [Candidatus Methanospirareceae archaeon]